MAVSIRVSMTRPNTSTIWPFDIWPAITSENFLTLEENGVQSWIDGNEDASLSLVVDHYFADNATYDSYKDTALSIIPLWSNASNAEEAAQYLIDNSITTEVTHVSDPVLSSFERIGTDRATNRA